VARENTEVTPTKGRPMMRGNRGGEGKGKYSGRGGELRLTQPEKRGHTTPTVQTGATLGFYSSRSDHQGRLDEDRRPEPKKKRHTAWRATRKLPSQTYDKTAARVKSARAPTRQGVLRTSNMRGGGKTPFPPPILGHALGVFGGRWTESRTPRRPGWGEPPISCHGFSCMTSQRDSVHAEKRLSGETRTNTER